MGGLSLYHFRSVANLFGRYGIAGRFEICSIWLWKPGRGISLQLLYAIWVLMGWIGNISCICLVCKRVGFFEVPCMVWFIGSLGRYWDVRRDIGTWIS